jgi:hypothetical protein
LTAEEVVVAFLKRSVLGQQLVWIIVCYSVMLKRDILLNGFASWTLRRNFSSTRQFLGRESLITTTNERGSLSDPWWVEDQKFEEYFFTDNCCN